MRQATGLREGIAADTGVEQCFQINRNEFRSWDTEVKYKKPTPALSCCWAQGLFGGFRLKWSNYRGE